MTPLTSLRREMESLATKERAAVSQRYFKTGKGEYGEGDIFIGLTVPQSREIAKKYKEISFEEVEELLQSKIHEERLISLYMLVFKFKNDAKKVFDFYLKNTKYVNNWDLVDSSAHLIVGEYLVDKPRDLLYSLARSQNLWEKRIAIIATFQFIRKNQFEDTIKIAEILMSDKHDLIHKAAGWMLREMGKKSEKSLLEFLNKHAQKMPRTMLRYSIERLSPERRKLYMTKAPVS
jgi:3-methyladenine DNA glycosylase AlkD